MSNINKLVDVVSLSKQQCLKPILCELKYATQDNFLGRIVDGYAKDCIDIGLLTQEAAQQLCEAQNYFVKHFQLSILIYDSLRPLRACKDFIKWMEDAPANDYELQRKKLHYPHLEKKDLAKLGYLAASVSKHCFGHVVDMGLVQLYNGALLNMGAIFDYFDEISHSTVNADVLGKEVFDHRMLLFKGMEQFGYKVHPKEFWHFEYRQQEVDEPYDFEISKKFRGINV